MFVQVFNHNLVFEISKYLFHHDLRNLFFAFPELLKLDLSNIYQSAKNRFLKLNKVGDFYYVNYFYNYYLQDYSCFATEKIEIEDTKVILYGIVDINLYINHILSSGYYSFSFFSRVIYKNKNIHIEFIFTNKDKLLDTCFKKKMISEIYTKEDISRYFGDLIDHPLLEYWVRTIEKRYTHIDIMGSFDKFQENDFILFVKYLSPEIKDSIKQKINTLASYFD